MRPCSDAVRLDSAGVTLRVAQARWLPVSHPRGRPDRRVAVVSLRRVPRSSDADSRHVLHAAVVSLHDLRRQQARFHVVHAQAVHARALHALQPAFHGLEARLVGAGARLEVLHALLDVV